MKPTWHALTDALNDLSTECHRANITWWEDPSTGKAIERNHGEIFMLMVSEIAEAMEGSRKDLVDAHIPHRHSVEVELADLLIRVFDYAGAHNLDLSGAFRDKMAYNARRPDHKPENRLKPGGKKW